MTSLAVFALTALLEIAGCFAFWAWARQSASSYWLIAGIVALAAFAWLLTRIDTEFGPTGGTWRAARSASRVRFSFCTARGRCRGVTAANRARGWSTRLLGCPH
jgi:hypothetical protein